MYLGVLPGQRARYIRGTTKLVLLSHATWLLHQTTSPASERAFAESLPILILETQACMVQHNWLTEREQTSSTVQSAVMTAWTKTKPWVY